MKLREYFSNKFRRKTPLEREDRAMERNMKELASLRSKYQDEMDRYSLYQYNKRDSALRGHGIIKRIVKKYLN